MATANPKGFSLSFSNNGSRSSAHPEAVCPDETGRARSKFQGAWKAARFWALLWIIAALPVQAEEPAVSSEPEEPPARVVFGPKTGLQILSGGNRLELHGYAWFRAQSETRVGDETDLDGSVPVARVFTIGEVLDSKLGFFAQVEFGGGDTTFLDLFGEWRFARAFRLRAGQFRTPYSRAYITPLTNLQLSTRGLVVDEFNLGRDTGVMASGELAEGLVHYDLAVVNGATINDRTGNRDSPSVISRIELRFGTPIPYDQAPSLTLEDPRGVTLGFGGAFSREAVKGVAGTSTEQLWNGAADLAWMHGPLSVRVEGFLRSAHGSPRPANALGAYGQLGVFVVPRVIEVGGRAGWLTNGPDVTTAEGFIAGYLKMGDLTLGHHLKCVLGYRYDSADADGADKRDRHLVRLQAQIFF